MTILGQEKPNIVLIMADDLGFECIGANGADDYKTPVLDKMAAEGMRFTNCFANPLCTPSRVKIMTGQYNVRNYVIFGLLDRKQTTFAQQLKKAGYTTCIAGKWQLGKEKDSPQHFGFDQACLWQHTRGRTKQGTTYDSRYSNPCLEINGVPKDYTSGEFGPEVCTEFICDFIEKNKDKPFCVYYPMLLTHCPFIPCPGSKDWNPESPGSPSYKGNAKYFGGMVNFVDKMVGQIIAKLDSLDLRKNTIVIFTGDNGTGKPVTTNFKSTKIKGGKGSMTDNGTRVPLIVRYPGKIKAGVISDELVEFSDIMPTLCEITGAPLPVGYPNDGVSFWNTLRGKEGRVKPYVYIWYNWQVLARDTEHMVRRKHPTSKLEYFKFSEPYKMEDVDPKTLAEKEQTVYTKLVNLISERDINRPEELNKPPPPKDKSKKKNKNPKKNKAN